jgi:hypothetical protein
MYSHRGWSYSKAASRARTAAYRPRRLPGQGLPGLPRFNPLPIALALVGAAAWYHFAFAGFSVHGAVVDTVTGQPIPGARVWSARATASAGDDGSFELGSVKPPDAIGFEAPGYRSETVRVTDPFQTVTPRLDPIGVELDAVDAETGLPVPAILDPRLAASTVGEGVMEISPVHDGQQFNLSATGYRPAVAAYAGEDVLRVPMQPRLDGQVTDGQTGMPLAGATVLAGTQVLQTDANGNFQLNQRPRSGYLEVLRPGYARGLLDLSEAVLLDVRLQPNTIRAVYASYFAIGNGDFRRNLISLIDSSEVNAVVIDVKGDYGLLSYRSQVPLAQQIGANGSPTIDDLDSVLQQLHQHGAYVIGRVVVFKDNMLARNGARAGLDVGIKDRRNGQLWKDGEGMAWVDPFQTAAWDYNTDLAREAVQHGFDEVQFDYIRFPTDPSPNASINDIQYSQPATEQSRVGALHNFLSQAHTAVNDAGGFLSMDTFGYTTWWKDDGGIGQDLGTLADDIDYYCPMIYPSTFLAGLPGGIPYPDVVTRPYDVVFQSLQHAEQKIDGKRVVLRPWLQYFDDYPWATQTTYDGPQVEDQKRAVTNANAVGWMLWNAGSQFDRGGFDPKS